MAWLLNIRGQDVPYTPVVHAYALLYKDCKVDLFCDLEKVAPELKEHLGSEVSCLPLEDISRVLKDFKGKSVVADPSLTPWALWNALEEGQANLMSRTDPVALPRAMKNAAEVSGTVSAHIRDGVAVSRFLAWLDAQPHPEKLTELSCAEQLLQYRKQGERFMDLSFSTIAATGPHGAIVHYQPTPESNRTLEMNSLFLLDSGAQYLDGTTDITRTIVIGQPHANHRKHFTLVLKGHIALAKSKFPYGSTGSQLDALARQYLWNEGLDYDHGTGHGVGSYLSVHEGPQRISRGISYQSLMPGMILSNEPGYYLENAYGIRIENLVLVEDLGLQNGRKWLSFQTLTLVPIDLRLVEPSLLSNEEKNWLNAYHKRVCETLSPLVDASTSLWLEKSCRPVH